VEDFEKLGLFYLGREYDLGKKARRDQLVLYDSKDLVTHAVCIGMTGSGKTGLCLSLLEEALIDGIPAIAIDPKGDLPNLLLAFPDLRPEDFAPWVNEGDAQRKGLTVEAHAAQQAELWKKGLAEWGQSGERIRRLREAADFAVYTPGSTAGLPVSIVKSFAAPAAAIRQDEELFRERISTTTSSLLGLAGIEADPLRSREHILVAKLLEAAWKEGRDLDLASLIHLVQTPPIARMGALELEAFYPAKDRFELATALNNLLASPGFEAWLTGEPLDVAAMLRSPSGKPRIAIFSIAHLNDAERMFFVSLLLEETLGWTRTQSGTTSLRALLYMDEIFGYFPPVADPPSKRPLLTLLKQARAFGVGVVLATQNPVDLDYKGLANTGTWFIGRLQTERDKARVLEGLEGVAAGTGTAFDRAAMEQLLAGLGSRIFLLNNVHDDAPVVFETRWAMSYLRGPMTRAEIKRLTDGRRPEAPAKTAGAAAAPATGAAATPAGGAAPAAAAPAPALVAAGPRVSARPLLPPAVPQYFLPLRGAAGGHVYQPALAGVTAIRYADAKGGLEVTQEVLFLTLMVDEALPVDWNRAQETSLVPGDLEREPQEPADWAPLPAAGSTAKSYDRWRKELAGWLYGNRRLSLLRLPGTKMLSRPDESERDFRVRLAEQTREERDRVKEQLRKKYAPKLGGLQERLRRAQQAVEREGEEATQAGVQTAISVGAAILGAVLGRKTVSATTLGRATTAARGAGRVLKERQDTGRARETVEALQQQIAEIEAEVEAQLAQLEQREDPLASPLETVAIKPRKTDITVRLCALAWAPYRVDAQGQATPAWE
jgi:hypothetical protein